jgi:hypothetical protein
LTGTTLKFGKAREFSVTLFPTMNDIGPVSWRPLSFQKQASMSLMALSVVSLHREILSLLGE